MGMPMAIAIMGGRFVIWESAAPKSWIAGQKLLYASNRALLRGMGVFWIMSSVLRIRGHASVEKGMLLISVG